jgi:hypothetical protein
MKRFEEVVDETLEDACRRLKASDKIKNQAREMSKMFYGMAGNRRIMAIACLKAALRLNHVVIPNRTMSRMFGCSETTIRKYFLMIAEKRRSEYGEAEKNSKGAGGQPH